MNTSTRFAGFILGLMAVFGIALGLGTLAGSSGDSPETHHSVPEIGAPTDPQTTPAATRHGN